MKAWLKMAIYAVAVSAIVVLGALLGSETRHRRTLQKEVTCQQVVIDSLLKRKMHTVSIQLYVTDRSKNNIYGRYNKGTISIPQSKTYLLEVDSTKIMN